MRPTLTTIWSLTLSPLGCLFFFSSWHSSCLINHILYLFTCLFVSMLSALEHQGNEGREFILFTLTLQGLEKWLGHSRPSTVKWTNKYLSHCLIYGLYSKINLRTAPSEKYFRVPEVQRLEQKYIKEQKQRAMVGFSLALSRV